MERKMNKSWVVVLVVLAVVLGGSLSSKVAQGARDIVGGIKRGDGDQVYQPQNFFGFGPPGGIGLGWPFGLLWPGGWGTGFPGILGWHRGLGGGTGPGIGGVGPGIGGAGPGVGRGTLLPGPGNGMAAAATATATATASDDNYKHP